MKSTINNLVIRWSTNPNLSIMVASPVDNVINEAFCEKLIGRFKEIPQSTHYRKILWLCLIDLKVEINCLNMYKDWFF